MALWNEENMVPLALDSSKSMVEKYFICNKPSYDNTKDIIFKCKDKWNLNIFYMESQEKLRKVRRQMTEMAIKEGFKYILIQDGDEIFYTEGMVNIKNIFQLLGNYNGIDSKMICLYKNFSSTLPENNSNSKWHGYSNNNIELIPHPTFFRSESYVGYSDKSGDMPHYRGPTIIHHWPLKFDCKVKTPIRTFLRRHFTPWHDGDYECTIEEYCFKYDPYTIEYLKKFPGATLQEISEKFYKEDNFISPYDEKRYFPYPSVIKKYIDRGFLFGCQGEIL